jgi:hypothetical protein
MAIPILRNRVPLGIQGLQLYTLTGSRIICSRREGSV